MIATDIPQAPPEYRSRSRRPRRARAPWPASEASFADWEQAGPTLPDWLTSYRHIVAEGKSANLSQPSPAQHDRSFPPPVLPDHTAGGS